MSTRKVLGTYLHSNVGYPCCIMWCVDCGAGIGRVSKRLLLPLFDSVDMEEQNPAFLKKAEEYLVNNVVNTVKVVCWYVRGQ